MNTTLTTYHVGDTITVLGTMGTVRNITTLSRGMQQLRVETTMGYYLVNNNGHVVRACS